MKRDAAIVRALAAGRLTSKRALLGVIDAIGPTDGRVVADTLAMPATVAAAGLDRLVVRGLVVLVWQHGPRRPRS